MSLSSFASSLPSGIREPLKALYRKFRPAPAEPIMYRVYLFDELMEMAGKNGFAGKRILEIGPRDGLDSKRLAQLNPEELVMIDLPEKHDVTRAWLDEVDCNKRFIEDNFMYMNDQDVGALGQFDLIWCTGVLYHNAEQLRFLRKLFKLLRPEGYLVMESSTLRGPKHIREGNYVQIHYPETFRGTTTVTHLPTAGAIMSWLQMVGFSTIRKSDCFAKENRDLIGLRMAAIAHKSSGDDGHSYYTKSGLNPEYRFGDST